MDPNTQSGSTRTEKMFILVNECADVIFDAVPVMMHSIDEDGIFLKVNPKWLLAMGYQSEEVLGHQFTGFLTEECRIQALSDGLPLFWEAGRVHSAAYRLLRKDGRVLYVALDAVVTPEAAGDRRALGVFRKADDLVQWQWAKNAMKALQSLVLAQHGIERIFLANEWPSQQDQSQPHPSVDPGDVSGPPQAAEELPWELLAIIQDIADSLKVLADLAADDNAEPNSHHHSLVTLSEAFQTALAA
jgi:PAS domain S-box-containing protein